MPMDKQLSQSVPSTDNGKLDFFMTHWMATDVAVQLKRETKSA